MNWFYSRTNAKVIVEKWRKHYNAVRPHSSLEYRKPLEFMSQWTPE
jgi:putative transposase